MTDYEKMRSFVKGYEDGKNGRYDTGWDPVCTLLTLGFGGGPTVDVEAYDEGYKAGRASVETGK